MNDLVVRLGARLRQILKQKGLSQEKLAEMCGLHVNYIEQIEQGEKNLTLETLGKVASGLEISLGELFQYVDPMAGPDKTSYR